MSWKRPSVAMVALVAQDGDIMKARIPKSYLNLPKSEQVAIDNLIYQEVNGRLTDEEVILFTQYTKMMCIVLHDYCGLNESELHQVIGGFRTLKRKYRKVKTEKDVNATLDQEMDRIFKESKFPQDYVERLQRDV